MSKCHVEELSGLYENIFRDASYAYPTLEGEFKSDLTRLQRLVNERGIHLYVVDLPAAGKHFDRCLSEGTYSLSGLPLTKRYSGRVVIPKFLRGLLLRVFDEHGRLKEDCDLEAIFFIRQIYFAAKKSSLDCELKYVLDEVKDFFDVDASLPTPDGFWDSDNPTYALAELVSGFHNQYYLAKWEPGDKLGSTFLTNLDSVAGLVASSLGPYRVKDWKFRHGPGAVSERRGAVNKYQFVNWSDRLERVFAFADCGFHNYCAWARALDGSEVGSAEPASRLIAVRKTFTKPRLIAAEPSEHQWCQQNIWHFFCSRVADSWIKEFVHFRDQTLNQELCIEGSRSNALATVDLSAASDRVTCSAVGALFRSNLELLCALQSTRTRFLEQDICKDVPERVKLRKFSTMGSACTFPVESLMFMSVAIAAVLTKRQLPVTLKNVTSLRREVAVFGDDIVIPGECRDLFSRALKVLDFKVNDSKSFWTGRFRESCGVDAFDGVNVTPAFWRSPTGKSPELIASKVCVTNNFYMKFLVHTAAFLASTIRSVHVPTVDVSSGVCGFKSFTGGRLGGLRRRWNPGLQRDEVRIPLLLGVVRRTPITDDSALLQYFTEDPDPLQPWSGGVGQRPCFKVKHGWVATEDVVAQQHQGS